MTTNTNNRKTNNSQINKNKLLDISYNNKLDDSKDITQRTTLTCNITSPSILKDRTNIDNQQNIRLSDNTKLFKKHSKLSS